MEVFLLYMILLWGVLGLIPFCYSLTSHLMVTLSLALPLWLGGLISSLLSSWKNMISHLLPIGSPVVLMPFLVIVESVSLLIRPLTLSIRLMANVMAGHLVLSLISGSVSSLAGPGVVLFGGFFLGFEVCVSVVQAYVFTTLLGLYWEE